ncbi:MAG: phage/plasmid primase, P4 family, partial [Chloroflexota bacterium]
MMSEPQNEQAILELEDKPTHKPTDDELGDMLIERWNGNVGYFYSQWHKYQAGVWLPFEELAMKRQIWELLKSLKHLGIRPADHKLNSVEKYLQAFLGVAEDSVDAQDDLINLQNGVFNIQTQELMPHKREYYLTSQLPFKFDPDTDCPMFRRFLNQSLVGEDGKTDYDLQLLVLEAIGYSLTNNTDFRVSFWLVGASGTGKSVLINVLQELAGNSHTSIDLDQLSNNPYQIADIAGKRLVTFTEPKSNAVLADNHYKRLVSQDTIMARQIFGNAVGGVGDAAGQLDQSTGASQRIDATVRDLTGGQGAG